MYLDEVYTCVYTFLMKTTTIRKWGNSYAVRLPKSTLQKLHLKAGHSVEIRETARGGSFSIIPVRTKAASLDELITRITKENRHTSTDFGEPVGKEIW